MKVADMKTADIDKAIADRAKVRIIKAGGRESLLGVVGILLGYNRQYHTFKVGFINSDGKYTGEKTVVSFNSIELVDEAPVKRDPRVIDPKPVGSVVIDAPAACCEHAPMYHGARGCDECGCTVARNAIADDAKAAEACVCPVRTDYHSLDCMTFRAAHNTTDTDTEENDNVTIKDGPLTERQIHILNHLRAGKRHEEIAKAWATVPGGDGEPRTITVSVVKQECQTITAKFGASTVMQAASLWATAQAYRETATLIGSHRPSHVDNETDVHVDHVLYGLMQILRERADRLTPR